MRPRWFSGGVRLASFNIENLFDRARLLSGTDWSEHRDLLDVYDQLTRRLQREHYTDADKAQIVTWLIALGLEGNDLGTYVILRQNRGKLIRRTQADGIVVAADGRGDWIGWVELTRTAVTDLAVRHTGMVVRDLNADVIAVVEAESRVALGRFNKDVLAPLSPWVYDHVMCIDGNDDRGIDVGLFTKMPLPIRRIVSHVDDRDAAGSIFSRDCPEYLVELPGGGDLLVLVNHFKSKGYGKASDSNARRRRQAVRVAEIYEQRRAEGVDHVVVVGDLNDTPDSAPLAPLIAQTDLQDVSRHPNFDDGGWPGTYTTGRAANKIDYILCSPSVFTAITDAGVMRLGVWTGSGRWPMYPSLTREQDAASDHAALWADLDL